MARTGKRTDVGELGAHIRRLRLSKHMSLGDLAAQVGTSRSFISQVEQGKALPSLGTLKSIASALAVTVGSLIDEPPTKTAGPVLRASSRPKIDRLHAGVVIEALTHRDTHKNMEPILARLEPGAISGQEGYVHNGQEFGIVIKGSLHMELDGATYELNEGDSIYYDSSRPHRFINPTDSETVVIWVITPPTF